MHVLCVSLLLYALISPCLAWISITNSRSVAPSLSQSTFLDGRRVLKPLRMGLLDGITGFLNSRQGDFIKMSDEDKEFGPGPLLVAFNVPSGVLDEEIMDMIEDGAPKAFRKGTRIIRVTNSDTLLDLPMADALEKAQSADAVSSEAAKAVSSSPIPVLLFSGFRNNEMMVVYNILGSEIYEETGGQSNAACAKAVPNAMRKPLRQVLEEISGDHTDAMQVEPQK